MNLRPLFSLVLLWPQFGTGAVTFWEEVPYFGAEDSPFYAGIQAGTIILEDFEDHELNTPNVVSWDSPLSDQIGRTYRDGNPNSTWSVDADDGLNGDFRGHDGDTWTTRSASNGQRLGRMEFRFEPDILGRYPSYVGFVVTEPHDYFEFVELVAVPESGVEGEWPDEYDSLTWIPPQSFPGDTRTHRFFGIHEESGISVLRLNNVAQIDHLQYGYAIPEPGAGLLASTGVFLLLARRRRRT